MAIKKSDLYSSLWASCDELRGGMDASQYKDYVLFMLFIKYISDKYGNSADFAPPVTISRLLGITDVDLHVEEVTGADKSLDVVVDIFNRVNSGGTKLSKGDLALAKICADWPEARGLMKEALRKWSD